MSKGYHMTKWLSPQGRYVTYGIACNVSVIKDLKQYCLWIYISWSICGSTIGLQKKMPSEKGFS